MIVPSGNLMNQPEINYAWYLDLTPNRMFSLPIPGKDGLPLCQQHGRQLEVKEVMFQDKETTKTFMSDY
jgi:hypothetical protein